MKRENILLLFVGALLCSCGNEVNSSRKAKRTATESDIIRSETSLRRCIGETDTLIDFRNSIRYVVVDTFYTIELKVGGLDTLLPYQFNCSVPRGLVPAFHSFYGNIICLIRGHGFDHREFLIGYVDSGQIVLKQYETALAVDLENEIVVYRDYDKPEHVIVERIKGGGRKIFVIPSSVTASGLPTATILRKNLELKFSDGRVINFTLQ